MSRRGGRGGQGRERGAAGGREGLEQPLRPPLPRPGLWALPLSAQLLFLALPYVSARTTGTDVVLFLEPEGLRELGGRTQPTRHPSGPEQSARDASPPPRSRIRVTGGRRHRSTGPSGAPQLAQGPRAGPVTLHAPPAPCAGGSQGPRRPASWLQHASGRITLCPGRPSALGLRDPGDSDTWPLRALPGVFQGGGRVTLGARFQHLLPGCLSSPDVRSLVSPAHRLLSEDPSRNTEAEVSVEEVYNNDVLDLLAGDRGTAVAGARREVLTSKAGRKEVSPLTCV